MSKQVTGLIDEETDWKRIQQKTFTRWCNQQLKVQNIFVEDLNMAFCDGVNLITLMEVLSLKSVGKYNKKPKIHAQKMDNVSKALEFIMKDEGIKLVNIGSEDIVTPNLKLILGLVWTLILHYQISQGFGIEIDDPTTEAIEGPSASQALLSYVQQKLPGKKINNLTSDWNDGVLIASLVDAHAPGLCTEVDTMKPENALENATLAMKLAEEWLDVPQLLEPQDMVNPKVDELSMMTYLSQFLEAKLKPGAPLKQRIDPSTIVQCKGIVATNDLLLKEFTYRKIGTSGCHPEKVMVGGSGLEGCGVHEALDITVDISEAGVGDLSINVDGPKELEAACSFDDANEAANLRLFAHKVGTYRMTVEYAEQETAGSPYRIRVWDPSKVAVSGSGITGISTSVGRPADIFVDLTDSGPGAVGILVEGPSGETYAIDASLTEIPNVYMGSYVPMVAGEHTVSIKVGDQEVANSPFALWICDLSKVMLDGPGLLKAVVDQSNTINVSTPHPVRGDLEVQFKSLLGSPQPVEYQCVPLDDTHYQISYTPHQVGMMEVTVLCGRLVIQHSYTIPCIDPTAVTISGPGVKPIILAGASAVFHVDASRSGPVDLEVSVTNPSRELVPAQTVRSEQGVYTVTYQPISAGEHTISVKVGGLEVAGSPCKVHVCNPKAVKATGPGLKLALLGEENLVEVSTDGTGLNKVDVSLKTLHEEDIAAEYRVLELDKCKHIYYTLHSVGTFDMVLSYLYGDQLVSSQSFTVQCVDPTMIVLDWKGVDAHVPIGKEVEIGISSEESGASGMDVSITGENGMVVCDPRVTALATDKHTVAFKIEHSGYYHMVIKNNDVTIPGCDYAFTAFDPKAIKVFGPGLSQAIMSRDNVIEVDTLQARGNGEVGVIFSSPLQPLSPVNYEIKLIQDNHYKIKYSPQQVGIYEVTVTYAGTPVGPGTVTIPCINPSVVTVNGRGLQSSVLVGSPVDFTIDASNAGPGTVDVAVMDAKGVRVPVDVEQTDCGLYSITYVPCTSGDYRARIKFGGLEVQGSPFVTQVCNPNSVAACGSGLKNATALSTNVFTVDSSHAGDGSLSVTIEGPEECNINCEESGDHEYCVSYVPPLAGTYNVNIKFSDVHIPGSPFLVTCSRASPDASKCHAVLDEENETVMVDARNAGGTGALEVGVWGSLVPARYITVEHNGDYTFNVSYEIPEPGETEISIKWHGQHISGSPFKVVTE